MQTPQLRIETDHHIALLFPLQRQEQVHTILRDECGNNLPCRNNFGDVRGGRCRLPFEFDCDSVIPRRVFMTRNRLFLGAAGAAILALSATGIAQLPVDNVNGKRHPHLLEAQRLCTQAFEQISVAQKANEFELGGHGAKAKELLEQANRELQLAAQAADRDTDRGHDRDKPRH